MVDLGSINIAICDDDSKWHREVAAFCTEFFDEKGADYNISSYYSGEELLKETEKYIDILFLDVEMDGMDGLAVKDKINNMPNFYKIIFVTSHQEIMQRAFGYKTVGFLTKPFRRNEINNILEELYSKIVSDSIIEFSDSNGSVYYYKSDIIYVMADSNYITVFSEKDEKVISCTLKKCETILQGLPFLRIHKSYIVNLDHVKDISNGSVNLINGMTITIGRSYRERVKSEYQKYLIRELHA